VSSKPSSALSSIASIVGQGGVGVDVNVAVGVGIAGVAVDFGCNIPAVGVGDCCTPWQAAKLKLISAKKKILEK